MIYGGEFASFENKGKGQVLLNGTVILDGIKHLAVRSPETKLTSRMSGTLTLKDIDFADLEVFEGDSNISKIVFDNVRRAEGPYSSPFSKLRTIEGTIETLGEGFTRIMALENVDIPNVKRLAHNSLSEILLRNEKLRYINIRNVEYLEHHSLYMYHDSKRPCLKMELDLSNVKVIEREAFNSSAKFKKLIVSDTLEQVSLDGIRYFPFNVSNIGRHLESLGLVKITNRGKYERIAYTKSDLDKMFNILESLWIRNGQLPSGLNGFKEAYFGNFYRAYNLELDDTTPIEELSLPHLERIVCDKPYKIYQSHLSGGFLGYAPYVKRVKLENLKTLLDVNNFHTCPMLEEVFIPSLETIEEVFTFNPNVLATNNKLSFYSQLGTNPNKKDRTMFYLCPKLKKITCKRHIKDWIIERVKTSSYRDSTTFKVDNVQWNIVD